MDEEKCGMLAEKGKDEVMSTPQAVIYKPGAKAPLEKRAFWRVLTR